MINGCSKHIQTKDIPSRKTIWSCRIISILCVLLFPYDQVLGQYQGASNENSPKGSLTEVIKNYQKKADSLTKIKKNHEAEKWYELAYQKAKIAQNDSLYISVGNEYTRFLYAKVNNIHKAIEVSQTIQKFCIRIKNINGLIQAYSRNAYALVLKGGSEKEALDFYNKAIALMDQSTPSITKMPVFVNKGRIFSSAGLTKIARRNFHLALSSYRETDNINFKIYILGEIRSTFGAKELDSASFYDQILLDYDTKLDLSEGDKNLIYNNAAYTLIQKQQAEKAKKLIEEKVYVDSKYTKTFNSNPARLHTIGAMHMELGEYTTAIKILETAKELAIDVKRLNVIVIILKDLSKCYENIGNFKASLETTRMIGPFWSALSNQNLKKEVAKLEIQRKLQETEKEVISLQEEKETISLQMNKAQLISYLLGILLVFGVFIYFYRVSVNKAKFYKLNEKVNHNRLLSLQSAMNPHFLFNSFGTLQHFILKKEIRKANSYMTTLSDLIRNVFASSNSIYIRFNSEIEILKSYIELELRRFDHSFEVVFDIPQELTNTNPMIPSMIVQPYVENAIIHGFSEKEEDKKLTLAFTRINAKSVQCEITDNGVGRKKVKEVQKDSKLKRKKNLSIATKNTQERLQIINKKDNQEGTIAIQDLYDANGNAIGTKVAITLPVAKSKIN